MVICHEDFRYPESVRYKVLKGAQLIFHPHLAGNDVQGILPIAWGNMENSYYEKAMMMRALENIVYFASCNYSFAYPESASSVIDPQGNCLAYQEYGVPGILVTEIDPRLASGFLAGRLKGEMHQIK